MWIASVKFKKDGKAYNFDSNDLNLEKNQYVLVETDKGLQLGTVCELIDSKNFTNKSELKKVIRIADDKDYNIYLKNLKDASLVLNDLKQKIVEEDIIMHVVDASYSFDKKHLIVNFVADERIDFRELVKYLAGKYKAHIELHQLGVRDKAKEIGGLGQCGMVLCCKSFKNNMDGISINMAKNQNLSLNPSKINGCCGRLLCCLSYENDTYSSIKEELPKVNSFIDVSGTKCKVTRVDILKRKVYVENDGQEVELDYGIE